MPKNARVTWGTWEGVPTALDTFECWCWDGEGWVEANRDDAWCKVPVLSKAMFNSMFGPLAPLPPEAFRPHPLRDAVAAVLVWGVDTIDWWRRRKRQ